jgi:hypothetical protein
MKHLRVVLPEGLGLYVVEHAYVAKDLLDLLSRPSTDGEMLDADVDMEEPLHRTGVGLEVSGLNEEGGGADEQRTRAQGSVALLWIVKPNKEVLRLVRQQGNASVRDAEVMVEHVGDIYGAGLEGGVLGGQHHIFVAQFLQQCRHRATGNHDHTAGNVAVRVSSHGSG